MKKDNLASFKLRLLAFCVSALSGWFLVLFLATSLISKSSLDTLVYNFVLFLVIALPLVLVVNYLLNPYLVSRLGGSVGKLLTGLRIVDESGKNLNFKRSFFRLNIGYPFSSLLFGLGFLSIIRDENKQGWHDKAVGSKVVVASNFWPLSLIILILLLAANIYFGSTFVQNIKQGTLPSEISTLVEEIKNPEEELMEEDEINIDESKNLDVFDEEFLEEELLDKEFDQLEDSESI